MTSTISIEIPREVVHATQMTPRDMQRELAIYLYYEEDVTTLKELGRL